MNFEIFIDDTTIYAGIVLLVLAIATPLVNIFFRKFTYGADDVLSDDESAPAPGISIIMTPSDKGFMIERHLDIFLSQQYRGEWQIIFVIEKGDAETEDALKRYAGNSRIYVTYIPQSSRYMSRKKLAITLGAKAAKYEWLLLSDIECRPNSDQWLSRMASHCTEGNNIVLGFTRYDDDTPTFRRFHRLLNDFYLFREAQLNTAYRYNGNALLMRKAEFFSEDGFLGNLKYLRGEYDFLANKYAQPLSTALETHPDGWLIEEAPTDKEWHNKNIFYQENRKHLNRSFIHRLKYNVDEGVMHLNYLLQLAVIAFGALSGRWILMTVAVVSLIITIVERTIMGHKAISYFYDNIPAWKIVPLELRLVWHSQATLIRYKRTDKMDFISHKL